MSDEYSADLVREAFPFVFEEYDGMGSSKREPGMPSGGGDPRKATMMLDIIADVRWCWKTCEWLSLDMRRAAVLSAMPYTEQECGFILNLSQQRYSDICGAAFREMSNWLNATEVQRIERVVNYV